MNPIDYDKAFSWRDVTAILVRRKRQIFITFVLVVAAVTIGTFLIPKQYESSMKILVKNGRSDTIVSPDANGGTSYRGEVSETQINTEIELLNSADLLQEVVTKTGLEGLERSSESVPAEHLAVTNEKARLRLQRELTITPVRKADIIQVDYAARDPLLAAAVLRQVAESYLEEHLKVHGTPGTYEFFKSEAARYQNTLTEAEAQLTEFRQREKIVVLAQQKDTMLLKAADSESALMQAEAAISDDTFKLADTRRLFGATEPRLVTQSRTVTNPVSVERLNTMLAELQNQRTALLLKFRSDDRLVQEADQQIADTNAAFERATKLTGREETTDVNPVHQTLEIDMAKGQAELAGMEARRQTLGLQGLSYSGQLTKLDNATAKYGDLVRNQKEAEDNYLLYAKKTEEARIAEALDQQKIANVAIAEAPTEPHLPSKPNVLLYLGLGVLLAGFLSLGLAFTAEYFADTVQQASDLEELTGLPVLATAYAS